MRPNQPHRYVNQPNPERCRATRRLRTRVQRAEARVEALEAELAALRAEMAAERAALVAHIESPEAERDLLVSAQSMVHAELLEQAHRREHCEKCGGLGYGMMAGLLRDRIDRHCIEHGLEIAGAVISKQSWPEQRRTWGMDRSWLSNLPRIERDQRQAERVTAARYQLKPVPRIRPETPYSPYDRV